LITAPPPDELGYALLLLLVVVLQGGFLDLLPDGLDAAFDGCPVPLFFQPFEDYPVVQGTYLQHTTPPT
jgi:hypothetical protein